jgi:hypothetical protein
MKIITAAALIIVSFFAACQKEIDWGLNTSQDQLLVKLYQKSGADSTVIYLTYNSAKKLIREITTGLQSSTAIDNDLKIYRTASGIIDRTVQVSLALVSAGIDSVVTKYNYNTASSRYTSAVFTTSFGGFDVTDSTVFTYDAAGKITSDDHYQRITGVPVPLHTVKNDYTYSSTGLNLMSIQISAASTVGGPLSPMATQTYTYDAKKSPLIMKEEAILLLRTGYYSANNVLSTAMVNTVDPTANFTLDNTYRYNAATKPDTAFSTRTPGGTTSTTKYYYQ